MHQNIESSNIARAVQMVEDSFYGLNQLAEKATELSETLLNSVNIIKKLIEVPRPDEIKSNVVFINPNVLRRAKTENFPFLLEKAIESDDIDRIYTCLEDYLNESRNLVNELYILCKNNEMVGVKNKKVVEHLRSVLNTVVQQTSIGKVMEAVMTTYGRSTR